MTSADHEDTQASAPRVWLLLGQKAGDNNQVLALAEALGWPYSGKRIVNRPWELISNLSLKITLAGIDQHRSDSLTPPWPDLLISAGRRNEPVARWVRRQSGNHTRIVHIGRPWSPLESWDLIVTTPQYNLPEASNILHNHLPLHRIDRARLDEAANAVHWPWLGQQRPYTAVMLGGNSGQFVFTPDKARHMGRLVSELVAAGGGTALVADSRRTPAPATRAFLAALQVPFYHHSWQSSEENPYLAFLALADYLVVTGESMSMLAEAAATGSPLYIFDLADRQGPWWRHLYNYSGKSLSHRLAMCVGPRRMRRDIARIQAWLVESGQACWLDDWQRAELPQRVTHAPRPAVACSEAATSAARVRQLFSPG